MGASFVLTIAIVMLKGVVPGVDDLVRVFLFFMAAMLYCTLFFALAMMRLRLSKKHRHDGIFIVGWCLRLHMCRCWPC